MPPPGIDLTVRLSLREGSVYYFTERTLTSADPHYFIVVNSDPLTRQVLLLSVVTSKVEEVKRRRADCLATVVEFSPKDFNVLKKPSIVDCNSLKTIPLAEFNERFIRKEIACFDQDLPLVLRKALRCAIHASNIVTDELKALVTQP
ncbi:MAG TPA: hypothetical protein VNP98_10365 [Chthoniobacterales bacterium]|nr:hypothetical protein [Chthoniobacterales bacterium]